VAGSIFSLRARKSASTASWRIRRVSQAAVTSALAVPVDFSPEDAAWPVKAPRTSGCAWRTFTSSSSVSSEIRCPLTVAA